MGDIDFVAVMACAHFGNAPAYERGIEWWRGQRAVAICVTIVVFGVSVNWGAIASWATIRAALANENYAIAVAIPNIARSRCNLASAGDSKSAAIGVIVIFFDRRIYR